MGIEDRAYYRDETPGSLLGGSAWKWIIAVTLGAFVVQVATSDRGGSPFESWLRLDAPDLFHGQVWRLLTYALCHDVGQIFHLLFNLLFIYWFGRALEGMVGPREFLLFYVVAVLAAGVAFVLLDLATPGAAYAIGASGGVMGVMGLYAWHFPRQKILLMFVIPVEIWLVVAVYTAFDLLPVLEELRGGASDGVAHAAHLGGLAFGLAYGKFGWRLERLLPSGRPKLRMPRRRPSLKVFDPAEERAELDRRVDAILTKISERGEASLTVRERKTLEEASRRYRKTH